MAAKLPTNSIDGFFFSAIRNSFSIFVPVLLKIAATSIFLSFSITPSILKKSDPFFYNLGVPPPKRTGGGKNVKGFKDIGFPLSIRSVNEDPIREFKEALSQFRKFVSFKEDIFI